MQTDQAARRLQFLFKGWFQADPASNAAIQAWITAASDLNREIDQQWTQLQQLLTVQQRDGVENDSCTDRLTSPLTAQQEISSLSKTGLLPPVQDRWRQPETSFDPGSSLHFQQATPAA